MSFNYELNKKCAHQLALIVNCNWLSIAILTQKVFIKYCYLNVVLI